MFRLGGHRLDPIQDYPNFNASMLGNVPGSGEADLREFSSPRHDQKVTSSCVAQSVIKALEIKRIQKHGMAAHVPLSVMDLYYSAREQMSPPETSVDHGTHIYLACQVLKEIGVCREIMNPFDEKNLYRPSPIMATRECYLNKIKACYKITSTGQDRINDVILNLRQGNPVVFGTLVGQSWFDYVGTSEPLRMTAAADSKGGHATCLVGWVKDCFITENSWGTDRGDNGYFWLRPEVIGSPISQDFWIISDGSEVWSQQ